MRSLALLVTSTVFLACLACGGGQGAREGAQSPDTTPAIAPAPTSAHAAEPTSDAGLAAPSTSGDAAPASSAADGSAPTKAAHTHDPGRGADDINAIVKAHRDEARACYDKALPDHPGIEGDLVITWTVDPKGNVTKTSLDMARSTIAEPTVVACISDIIKKILFAPSPGGFETKASYPFNFHPRHAKQGP